MSDTHTAVCRGVVKIYRTATGEVNALRGVDADVLPAGITAVMGPSGSGKSTLLRLLATLERPTAGTIQLHGKDVTSLPRRELYRIRRDLVGFVFQRPSDNLIPDLRSADQLVHAAALRGREAATDELLHIVGLEQRARSLPEELSGGEQQRLGIARALAGGAPLVLADEPTAELDSGGARTVIEAMREAATGGTAFVVATHDSAIAQVADTVISLRHGAIEWERREGRMLAVIDPAGRIQIPESALSAYPERRALVRHDSDGRIEIEPP